MNCYCLKNACLRESSEGREYYNCLDKKCSYFSWAQSDYVPVNALKLNEVNDHPNTLVHERLYSAGNINYT